MKKWLKIEALVGDDLLYKSNPVVYINPDLIGDTVYKVYERSMPKYIYKVEYGKTWLWFTEESFNSLLNYFKSLEREEKINSIIE